MFSDHNGIKLKIDSREIIGNSTNKNITAGAYFCN